MEIRYNQLITTTDTLDIDNIGQVAIRATDIIGQEYYLVIRTNMGTSYVFNYGPIMPDILVTPDEISCKLSKINFNEERLAKLVDFFLNDKKKKIQRAEVVSDTEAFDCCMDLIQYMRDYRID